LGIENGIFGEIVEQVVGGFFSQKSLFISIRKAIKKLLELLL
jgi:hypothetical protein